jgi:galactose mutarotase-like enzyme
VTLRYVSPDGDQGYPGTLTVDRDLFARRAEQPDDRIYARPPTSRRSSNLTNHAYWNLSGEGSSNGAMGHVVTIPAQTYLPTDAMARSRPASSSRSPAPCSISASHMADRPPRARGQATADRVRRAAMTIIG